MRIWTFRIFFFFLVKTAVVSTYQCEVSESGNGRVEITSLSCHCIHYSEKNIEQYYDSWSGAWRNRIGKLLRTYTECYRFVNNSTLHIDTCPEDICEHITFFSSEISTIPINFFRATPHVKEIYLNSSRIEHLQVGAFAGLSNLQTLQLEDNELTKINVGTFNNLEKLRNLDLNSNRLETIESDAFLGLSSLIELDLSKNQLRSVPFNLFNHLQNIKTLILSHNHLSVIDFNSAMLNNLETLYLNDNNIANIEECFNNTILDSLFLQDNAILHINESCFPTTLTILDLANNNVSSLDYCSDLNLVSLMMSNNRLGEIPIDIFENLETLQKLDLSLNEISFIKTGTFSTTNSIQYLNLSATQLKEIDPNVLIPLNNLRSLDISFNNLTYFDPQCFSHFDDFQTLYIQGNIFSCEVVSSIFRESRSKNFSLSYENNYSIENIKGLPCNYIEKKVLSENETASIDTSGSNWKRIMEYINNVTVSFRTMENLQKSSIENMKNDIEHSLRSENEKIISNILNVEKKMQENIEIEKGSKLLYFNTSNIPYVKYYEPLSNHTARDMDEKFSDSLYELKRWTIIGFTIFPCVYITMKILSCFLNSRRKVESFELGQEMPMLS